jgi:TIR domain
MQLFISYAQKDIGLASTLSERLSQEGLKVWTANDKIHPGDNWATKIGQALDESDLMLVLLTPGAMESDWLRQEIEFAIGSRKYEGRVFAIFVGSSADMGKDMPWILRKLRYFHVESAKELGKVAKEIALSLRTNPNVSKANA